MLDELQLEAIRQREASIKQHATMLRNELDLLANILHLDRVEYPDDYDNYYAPNGAMLTPSEIDNLSDRVRTIETAFTKD